MSFIIERQVAYNMFKAMNGGVSASPDPYSRGSQESKVRFKSASPKPKVTANYAYKPANARTRAPAATQLYQSQPAVQLQQQQQLPREDQAVRDLARSLEG